MENNHAIHGKLTISMATVQWLCLITRGIWMWIRLIRHEIWGSLCSNLCVLYRHDVRRGYSQQKSGSNNLVGIPWDIEHRI